MHRVGFRGNKIVLAAPVEKMIGGALQLPAADNAARSNFARVELARQSRCTPDALEVNCWDIPSARELPVDSARVMVLGLRHEDASPVLDPYEQAGFDVVALDARPCALARASAPFCSADSDSVTAILELEWTSALIVLLHRGVIIYERKLAAVGLEACHDQLCKKLGLAPEAAYHLMENGESGEFLPRPIARLLRGQVDSIGAEIRASVDYAAQEQIADGQVRQILLCGEGAQRRGIDAELSNLLCAPVTPLTPAGLFHGAQATGAIQSPAMVTALGLAMFEG
jgi:Tfp pilus assembly PilM family ATPase